MAPKGSKKSPMEFVTEWRRSHPWLKSEFVNNEFCVGCSTCMSAGVDGVWRRLHPFTVNKKKPRNLMLKCTKHLMLM